jgi:hypothetical protein
MNDPRLPITLSLRYLNAVELCAFSTTSRESYVATNSNSLWKDLCIKRFSGKCIRVLRDTHLFVFGVYDEKDLTNKEMRDILRLRGCRGSLIDKGREDLVKRYIELKNFNHLKRMRCCKYKCSLVHAILDSSRERITKQEVGYFRWKLFYQNRPSSTGIRHFREDGVYDSPYLGRANWDLTKNGEFIIHGFTRPLSVRRRREDWGWTIGKGSRSEYWSILPPSTLSSSSSCSTKNHSSSFSTSSTSYMRNVIQRFLSSS